MLTVHIEKRGDFYMAFHQDARDIKHAIGDITLIKSNGADAIGIPAHALEQHVDELNRKGISVKINGAIGARQ